jgi:hypothetical protein
MSVKFAVCTMTMVLLSKYFIVKAVVSVELEEKKTFSTVKLASAAFLFI